MRFRRDLFLVANIFYTVALLWLTPWALQNTLTSISRNPAGDLNVWRETALQYMHYFGVASLVLILIGLTITWLGYFNSARWTWWVQFIITLWVFCLFVLPIAGPILRGRIVVTLTEWAYIAIHQSGLFRNYAESFLIFALMLLALIVSATSFFRPQRVPVVSKRPPIRIAYVVGALVGVSALFLWINFRQYEIPPAELNAGRNVMSAVPPPPAPPSEKEQR
jgi:hypothetical protein